LVLILLLSAGCQKQPTETASPGEVVEKEEADTSIKTPSEPERYPEVTPESEPEKESQQPAAPNSSEDVSNPSSEEEEKAARIEQCLKEANEVYDRMEADNAVFFSLYVYLKDYPKGGDFKQPLKELPEFPEIDAEKISEATNYVSMYETSWAHFIVIDLKENSREAMTDSIKKIMEHDNIYTVKVTYYSIIGC
jgi:hypothetical protein